MLIEKINTLIAEALEAVKLEKNEAAKIEKNKRVGTIRLIKAILLNLQKSGKPYSEESELNALMKMKAQIEDSIKQYTEANRNELADRERFDLSVLMEFLPKQATDEEIAEATNKAIDELGHTPTMADMKIVLGKVKETYPTVNGGIVSKLLKERMK